jgi:hypothetical protein
LTVISVKNLRSANRNGKKIILAFAAEVKLGPTANVKARLSFLGHTIARELRQTRLPYGFERVKFIEER